MLFVFVAGFASPLAMAEEIKIDITAPLDGAKLNVKGPNTLDFNITPVGTRGHLKIYVDDNKVDTLYQMKGRYTFNKTLPLGDHVICIKLYDKIREIEAAQHCVTVSVFRPKGGRTTVDP
jgi:hypothetical protein